MSLNSLSLCKLSLYPVFRRANGVNGFVPANYVKEIEHKLVSVEVKKPVVVKDVRKAKPLFLLFFYCLPFLSSPDRKSVV